MYAAAFLTLYVPLGWFDPASGKRLPLAGSTEDAFEIVMR